MGTSAFEIKRDSSGDRIYTPKEHMSLDHTDLVKDFMIEKTGILIDSMVFGKKSSAQCLLNLMNNLKFYLGIMYDEKLADEAISIVYDDTYYKTKYCIDSIQDLLLCKGIPGSLVQKIIDLYFTEPTTGTGVSGIGVMEIEGITTPFKIS